MITKLQILKHDNGGARIGVEIKDMVKNLKWVTDLNYSAGELTFDIINGKDPIIPAMGAIVDFAWDNKDIFWGFVFSAECTSDTTVSVKAYDFERYLKSEGSVVFQSGTLGDRYSNVCRRFGVPFNIREQPNYRVPAEVCDGKTGFDMIKSAIDKTYAATGEMYCIVANHMIIELRRAPIPTRTLLVIDTQNTMSDYTYSESIDNAANVVQVVQKNTDNSQTKTATATSDTGDDPATTSFTIASARGNTIKTWGQIVKVVNAKNKANWAQMVQQASDELKKRNVSERKLTLDCMGDTSLIAGAGANVKIKDFGKTWTNCPILKATHNFGTDYTCSLEMKVGTKWQENSL